MTKQRSRLVALLGCFVVLGVIVLSGCSGTVGSTNLSQVKPIATVPYLPPTVVPNTPVPTTTATVTATATPKPHTV